MLHLWPTQNELEWIMIMLLLALALVGFLVYCIITYIPMPQIFKTGIIVIATVLIIMYLIRIFNLDLPLPR